MPFEKGKIKIYMRYSSKSYWRELYLRYSNYAVIVEIQRTTGLRDGQIIRNVNIWDMQKRQPVLPHG